MIVVVGEALIDLVIDPSGGVESVLGGAPFNTARACGRLGADVAFAGAIGTDLFGSRLAAQLLEDGVTPEFAPRVDRPTTLAAAELDEGGAASYRFYISGTSAPELSDPVALPGDVDVLFTGGLGLVLEPMATAVEALIDRVSETDAMVMVDVNCRPLIVPDRDAYVERVRRVVAQADIVKVSDEDLAYLAPGRPPLDAANEILASGPKVVLVTAGGDGVHVVTASGSAVVPVESVAVVDTIGAGDSFGAGFLIWWTEGDHETAALSDLDTVTAAVRAANTVAGIVCSRRGANPPWRRELPDDWSS